MNWLRSFLYNGLFLAGTGLILVLVSPLLLTTRDRCLSFVAWWSRVQSRSLKILVNLDHEVRGLENIPDEPAIYACKHQSAWDTFFFFLIFNNPAYVLKRELLDIPVWGAYARKCEAIAVDRDGGATALKALIRDTRDRLASGRAVIIFPEGTRVPPGQRRPYHPGVAALYSQCDVPVIPVALNSGLFWGRRSYRKSPGRILVEFLPPVPDGLKRPEFMKALEDAIEPTAERLVAEAVERYPEIARARADSADRAPSNPVG